MYRRHSQLLCQGLANLAAQGLFRREAFPGEYVRVVDTVFLTAVYWLPFCEIKGEVSSFRTQAWSVLHPLLTEAGRRRGFLLARGEIDTERMARVLLEEYRSCKIGRFTLEDPPERTEACATN